MRHNPPVHKLLEGVECPSLSVSRHLRLVPPPHILVAVNTHTHSKCTMQKWCMLWCRPSQRPTSTTSTTSTTSEFRAHDAHCSSLRSKQLLIGSVFVFQSDLRPTRSPSQRAGQGEGEGEGARRLLPICHFVFYHTACSSPSSSPQNVSIVARRTCAHSSPLCKPLPLWFHSSHSPLEFHRRDKPNANGR